MAEHYTGKNLLVNFGAVDISAYARSCTINEDAGAAETIDSTHKGDTERTTIEGFPGAQETTVEYMMVDIYDSMTAFGSMALNSKDTLTIYPYGNTSTYPMLTLQNARLHARSEPIVYDGLTEISGTFNAKNSLTRSTTTG